MQIKQYAIAIIRVFMPLALVLVCQDAMAEVTVDEESLEQTAQKVEQWISRGMVVMSSGGLAMAGYYGFARNDWMAAVPGAAIGIGLPVVGTAVKSMYGLLI
jgi:hypothetical protein